MGVPTSDLLQTVGDWSLIAEISICSHNTRTAKTSSVVGLDGQAGTNPSSNTDWDGDL